MLQTTKVIHEDVTSPVANEKYGQIDLTAAIDNFWHYRCVMNPRLTLKGMWFPRTLATKLRTFWEDFKAGRRPVMLLMTPPQHGKSLSVIDFIGEDSPIRREEMSPTPPGESRRSIAPAATQTLERHATNVGAAATISSAPAGTFLR